MKNSMIVSAAAVGLFLLAGCSGADATAEDPVSEPQGETASAETSDTAPPSSVQSSGVPLSVLKNYAFWSLTGPNIPADPPAGSACTSPLDAVAYHVIGCADPDGNDISPSSPRGIYCSANDGSGVTSLQSQCLGGWLMVVNAINGKRIPSNVVLTHANKVAASVTAVVLLECPTPPAGLAQHNVIYKAVYNDGIFAPKTPDGCTPYALGGS
jgi:hypothetical protein